MFYIKEELLFHISDAGRCIQISVGSKRYNMIVSLSNEINILGVGVDGVPISIVDFQALDLGSIPVDAKPSRRTFLTICFVIVILSLFHFIHTENLIS